MDTYQILIVDDQRDVRRVLRAGLETLDVTLDIVDVPSGEEAMLVITHKPVNLLVADVRLPGISGLELIRQAQRRNPGLKLILITGVTDPQIRQQVADAGADAFFYKPIDMADFLDAVERCLGLVETILPPAPIQPEEKEEPSLNFPERLSGLRQEVGAASVLLLDDRGRVVARAGDLPDVADETNLIPSIMATISVSNKVSPILGMDVPDNLLSFAGVKYHLHLAPVGPSMALLLMSTAPCDDEELKAILTAVRPAVKDLHAILERIGVPVTSTRELPDLSAVAESEDEPEGEEIAPALDEIFNQASMEQLKPGEVDQFWESLAEEGDEGSVINADALSYEQARQLGLAPDEED